MRRRAERDYEYQYNAMEEAVDDAEHLNASTISREHQQSNIKGDEKNIAILFFLYLLQGIPLGLSNSIPMLLQNHGVSYKQQVCILFNNEYLVLECIFTANNL